MSDLMQDLMDFMESEEAKQLDIKLGIEEKERFTIKSMDQANYFIKRIVALNQEKDNVRALSKSELERTKERLALWEQKKTESIDNQINYLSGLLEEFAKENLPTGKKTLELPAGKLQFKKQQPAYKYNEELLLESLKAIQAEQFIVASPVTYSVDKNALKKEGVIVKGQLYINDRPVEGVTVEERPQQFIVK